ncbi:methyltransferase domain-containing protein [candidate division CSSED10-310 bacterium]|uniref:Methyltransferase domain-containing protein n=1 Tax=candidate division CSSED10-310 bacterium TaxID=2855610 RepID=A0ABV6YVQ1_UNCC1
MSKLSFPVHPAPEVSIIIPTFNNVESLHQCLTSIMHYCDVAAELIIIDDCSTDTTPQLLQSIEHIHRIRNEVNLEFIRSCNQGAAKAQGQYLLFVNDDVVATPHSFSAMVKVMKHNKKCGAVGAKLILPNGKLQEAGSIIWPDGSTEGYGRDGNPDEPDYCYQREVDFCSAAFLLVRRDLFQQLKGFDERYVPAYYEDADLCYGIRQLGYKVIYQPEAVVYHREFHSRKASHVMHLMENNKQLFVSKWAPDLTQQKIDTIAGEEQSAHEGPFLTNKGYCCTCDQEVTFIAENEWLRDFYVCNNCSSIPRERALIYCIEKFYPDWRSYAIHEISPIDRGASKKLRLQCPGYSMSMFSPHVPLGTDLTGGMRNENIETMTFADETFDLVISQDVLEHIFQPDKAFAEIGRVLKPGGAHIFAVPLINKEKASEQWARMNESGEIDYLNKPEYHTSSDGSDSLVTMHWGYDIVDFIIKHSGLSTTIVYLDNLELGIRAEYIEILISRKIAASDETPLEIHPKFNLPKGKKVILNELLKAHTTATVSLKKIFGDVDDDFWFWIFTDGFSQHPLLANLLPGMPDEKIQCQFAGASGKDTLRDAFSVYKLFKRIAGEYAIDLKRCAAVMDFGCGWGRITRFFLKEIEADRLYGIDCLKEVIALCQQSNMRCHFETIDPLPPTGFPDDMFDLIFCYSVFSHLSEDAHQKWLLEFQRILKPGGILIATTRPRYFIIYCAELRQREVKFFELGGAASFPNTEQSLLDYDHGKYCYDGTGGGGVLDRSIFGETCIPKKYVEEHWTKHFSSVDFIYEEEHKSFNQNVIVAQK